MSERFVIESGDFGTLLRVLKDYGYQTVGPTVLDGAIVYDVLASVDDMPVGMADEQEAASCRLFKRGDHAFFGWGAGLCGRCITWCPAGIDVTEEIRRLKE